MKYCLYVFLSIAVIQRYGRRRRSVIRAVQMDNLKGLLAIRRLEKAPNAQIREFCGVDERIDEGVL